MEKKGKAHRGMALDGYQILFFFFFTVSVFPIR